jgi:hypothetical protein
VSTPTLSIKPFSSFLTFAVYLGYEICLQNQNQASDSSCHHSCHHHFFFLVLGLNCNLLLVEPSGQCFLPGHPGCHCLLSLTICSALTIAAPQWMRWMFPGALLSRVTHLRLLQVLFKKYPCIFKSLLLPVHQIMRNFSMPMPTLGILPRLGPSFLLRPHGPSASLPWRCCLPGPFSQG